MAVYPYPTMSRASTRGLAVLNGRPARCYVRDSALLAVAIRTDIGLEYAGWCEGTGYSQEVFAGRAKVHEMYVGCVFRET